MQKIKNDPNERIIILLWHLAAKAGAASNFWKGVKWKTGCLKGSKLEDLHISNADVLVTSGQKIHPIAIPSSNANDCIEGCLFELTKQELLQADDYEVSDYKRIEAQFKSGRTGWVYIKR